MPNTLLSVLATSGMLKEEQVISIEQSSHGDEKKIESILLHEGHLTVPQLNQLKAQVFGWTSIDLVHESLQKEVELTLPMSFSYANKVIVFRRKATNKLAVVSSDPRKARLNRILRKKLGAFDLLFADEKSIEESMKIFEQSSLTQRVETILQSHSLVKKREQLLGDVSIMNLVDAVLSHAIGQHASDVHIEPRAASTIVRERVDGLLRQVLDYPKDLHSSVVLRIKVLSNLATDEHGMPQDGKMVYKSPEGKRADIRVSILPTAYGEKLVLRILISESGALPLEQIGLSKRDLHIMEQEVDTSPWGMILVTGPTGSGKTSTLYTVVNRLNKEHVNIATIEDPIEYELNGINQSQVNEKAGLTFAGGLRSILRQDPNIILVGEIRDGETASIAVSSAMTGHLVLSTLHTNDSPTAIPRLIDMGIEPFLISSTVNLIVGQRLVRKICARCKQSQEVTKEFLSTSLPIDLATKLLKRGKASYRFYQGAGCDLCKGTGYKGRMGIFELLKVDDAIRTLIIGHADADVIRKTAIESGMTTMLDDGIEKALEGQTTLEEVLRVIRLP